MIEVRARRDGLCVCDGCGNTKNAPVDIAASLSHGEVSFVLCQECARDLANAVGFMCVRDGGWSKLEPRKRKAKP